MLEPPSAAPRSPGFASVAFAWLGGATFVASLLVFLYDYQVSYGTARASQWPWAVMAADVVLFSLFGLHHSAFARTGVKRLVTRAFPPWLERSIYTWVASILFLIVCLAWQPLPGVLYAVRGGWRVIGYLVQLVGFLLTALASEAIDVLDLAGVRQVLDARDRVPPHHAPLETRGVYRLVRHPLYFGWALFVFGVPTMTATRALFAIVSTAYLVIGIPFEERSLLAVFGDEYRAYQQRTRSRMIPGVW
jgi:methanethiol S-methyltransferase